MERHPERGHGIGGYEVKTFAVRDGSAIMGSNGQPEVVEGYSKVQADLNDILLTPFEASRDFGNELLTGGVILAERLAIPGLVSRDVSAAIGRLIRFQARIPRAHMPDNERIVRVRSITTTPLGALGVAFLAVVSVADRSAEDVRKVFKISNSHLSR